LSTGHSFSVASITVCQNIRANKLIIVMAIAMVMCVCMVPLNLLWRGDMKKGYQLGAKQLCEAAHTTCHVA
jgi:hypothetical protein